MLLKIIGQEAFDKLDKAIQSLYNKKDDGKYHLDIEDDSGDALKKAKEHEKEARKEAERKLAVLQEEKDKQATEKRDIEDKIKTDALKKAGDVEALEASWKAKVAAAEAAGADRLTSLQKTLDKSLIENVASDLANKISTAPTLLKDIIAKRLSVEITSEGTGITRVLDAAGKPSALSIADLEKEFIDNKEFSAIIKGSNGSGGGATGNQSGGGASDKAIKDMTATEEALYGNANPEAYQQYLATKK